MRLIFVLSTEIVLERHIQTGKLQRPERSRSVGGQTVNEVGVENGLEVCLKRSKLHFDPNWQQNVKWPRERGLGGKGV